MTKDFFFFFIGYFRLLILTITTTFLIYMPLPQVDEMSILKIVNFYNK